jgi:uncharacterized protein DUF6263
MRIVWFVVLPALLTSAGCKKSEMAPKSASADASSETAPAAAADSGPVALRVKWPVGNRYSQRMEVSGDTETLMPFSSKPMLQKVSINQEYSVTVLGERPRNGRELELEFESAEIDVNMNGKPVMTLDTRAEAGAEASNPLASGFRQVIGTKIKFLLDESNHIEKVDGVKEFIAKASAGSNPQGRAVMQSMFSEEYFKHTVDFQRGLPPNPVKIGDTWPVKSDLTIPVLGVMNMDMNYTFKGWEQREKRKCATIGFTGTMSSKGEGGNPTTMGMTMKVESGKISGTTWFDPELGHPVESSFDQDMLMLMTLPIGRAKANGDAAGATPQSVTNNTRQKIAIKLVDIVSAGK